MNGRVLLLVTATGCGWTALLAAAVGSRSTPLVAVLAGLVSLGVWHRLGRAAAAAVALGCLVQLASSTSMVAAGVAGVLVLAHLVLVDLAADAHGAPAGAVGEALLPLAPGGLLAACSAVVVGAAALLGSGAPASVVAPALLAAPMLLLSAMLLALGMQSRRTAWGTTTPRRLSALTRRYLARSGLRS